MIGELRGRSPALLERSLTVLDSLTMLDSAERRMQRFGMMNAIMTAVNAMMLRWLRRCGMLMLTLLLSGCAGDPNALVMREGFHEGLPRVSVNEAAQISGFMASTLFVVPETAAATAVGSSAPGPLTCEGIVQGMNGQLAKGGKALRVRFEFSLEKREQYAALIAQPLSSWHGTPLEPAEVRARLEGAPLAEVLEVVAEQLGLNVLWYSGTVVLAEHFIGNL